MNVAPILAKTEACVRILLTASAVHVPLVMLEKDVKGFKSNADMTTLV